MNEVLQTKLSEILEMGKMGVLQAADMLKEQVPDLVAQILRWEFVMSLGWWLIGIMCMVISYKCIKRILVTVKKEQERSGHYYTDSSTTKVTISSIIGVITLVAGIGNFFSSYDWLQILVAPKLFLVQYITRLIK